MKETLIFASNNAHKIEEINQILGDDFKILSMAEAQIFQDIDETGTTFRENALIKAQYIYNLTSQHCFADDSGLQIDALNAEPGVYSARYAGEQKNDQDNIDKVLDNLKNQNNRNANFITVICLIWNQNIYFFEGKVYGTITENRRGTQGFGYDSIFLPNGYDKTFGEMSALEKNNISHRKNAVIEMEKFFKNN